MSEIITTKVGADGIADIHWDDPSSKVNIFSPAAINEFQDTVDRVISDEGIRGILITSGKKTFHVGADLRMVGGFFEKSAEDLWSIMSGVMRCFYSLETCGKPVAAAINGHALGGGFEMALATHARFASDEPDIKIGLPEASLGLMPGFGGTQRMTRIAPYQRATRDILEGATYDPETAHSLGLVDAVVPAEVLIWTARRWISKNAGTGNPQMTRGFSTDYKSAAFERFFYGINAALASGIAEDAPEKKLIADAIYHGLQIQIEPALKLEIRRFIELTRLPQAKEKLQSRFS